MQKYEVKALEVHDFSHIWSLDKIKQRMDFMVRNGMNVLVLHEPGIEDKVVFPGKFLGADKNTTNYFKIFLQIDRNIYNFALRENLNLNRRAYLRHVIREANKLGIEVYIENKELWFPDFILKYKADIVKNGVFCPSDPFWWEEFLPGKYEELFIALPELAGVIVSIGTGEARLAISNTFTCDCKRCRGLDPTEWYKNVIMGMYAPFKKAGKKLVVRDFIYTKEEQEKFAQGFAELPGDIVLSLKNTPHDFYPTFPNNPLIGKIKEHPQWIEYDVMGQFYGWGAVPSIMLEDIKKRLEHGLKHGVTGFIARTDWEGVQSYSCFDNLNLINLYGIAIFGDNITSSNYDVYSRWIEEGDILEKGLSSRDLRVVTEWIGGVMDQTWPVIKNTLFARGAVFSHDSCLHLSLEQPTFIAEIHHSLKNWDPTTDPLRMDKENLEMLLEESDVALSLVGNLCDRVRKCGNVGLKEDFYERLIEYFEFMSLYVRAFRLTRRAYCFARYIKENGKDSNFGSSRAIVLLRETLEEMEKLRKELIASNILDVYPRNELLDPERFELFLSEAKEFYEKMKS